LLSRTLRITCAFLALTVVRMVSFVEITIGRPSHLRVFGILLLSGCPSTNADLTQHVIFRIL